MKLLSILLLSYNNLDRVYGTLDSIFRQDHTNTPFTVRITGKNTMTPVPDFKNSTEHTATGSRLPFRLSGVRLKDRRQSPVSSRKKTISAPWGYSPRKTAQKFPMDRKT